MHELHDTTVTSDVTSALNYKQGIERQLSNSSVDFFTDDSQTSILKNAPFTKTCYELNFGTLNHALYQTAASYGGPISPDNLDHLYKLTDSNICKLL